MLAAVATTFLGRHTTMLSLPCLAVKQSAVVGALGSSAPLSTATASLLAYDPSGAPAYEGPANAGLELVAVVAVMRHGDRGPISRQAGSFVPGDATFWDSRMPASDEAAAWEATHPVDGPSMTIDTDPPYGMLTALGALQARRYGAELRARYTLHALVHTTY